MIEIRLPKPGPEIENATITKWESKEGDKIQIGDILAIIKTPIGSFKVAAEEQGILENVIQPAGSSIDFDEPIAIMKPDLTISDFPDLAHQVNDETMELPIDGGNETDSDMEPPIPDERDGEATDYELPEPSGIEDQTQIEEITETDAEDEDRDDTTEEVNENTEPENLETPIEGAEPPTPEEADTPGQDLESTEEEVVSETIQIAEPEVEVSPAARKIAERANIDLSAIVGTGDNGKILYIDVENAIKQREIETAAHQDNLGATETTEFEVQGEPAEVNTDVPDEDPAMGGETAKSSSEPDAPEAVERGEEAETEGPVELKMPSAENELLQPDFEQTEEWKASETEELPSIESISVPLQMDDAEQHETDLNFEETHSETDAEPILEAEGENESVLEPQIALESNPEPEPIAEQTVEETETHFEIPEPPQDQPFPDFDEISTQFHISKKDDLIIPFNSTKKAFGETQIESNQTVPHYYLTSDFDITDAESWLAEYNQKHNARITFTDLFIKATGQSLAMMPEMNAFVRQDRMILKRSINIGLATSIDEGVVTPVIPDIYHKPLHKVAETVRKNVDLAIKSKVILDYDTTFTISQMEEAGIKRYAPLITPPQTACLALGSAQKRVVPKDDFIAIRKIVEATLACDARAVDAANASKFLQSIKESIESLKIGNEDPDWIEGNEQLRLI